MNILLWILFGGLVGWMASMMMRTDTSHGMLTDILLGIAGAFVGGFIFNLFGANGVSGFNVYSMIVALAGSVVLIWLRRMMIRG